MAVAIALIVAFVIVPLSALAVDAGMMRVARVDMQAVADAAVLDMARDLGTGTTPTAVLASASAARSSGSIGATPSLNVALGYVSPNATLISDQGRGCGGPSYDSYFSTVPNGGRANAVLVTASTSVSFSLRGGSGGVCRSAVASLAGAGGGLGMAMTISLCNWDAATASGTTFASAPPYPSWPLPGLLGYLGVAPAAGTAGGEQVLSFHGSGNDCSGSPSGFQLPGGFGWLSDPGANCQVNISAQGTYGAQPGNAANAACETLFDASYADHTPVYIPVYDGVSGTGANGLYHLKGWAAFVVTGIYMHGHGVADDKPSSITGLTYCGGSLNMCLYGVFTQGLVPNPTPCPTASTCLPGGWTMKLAG